MKKNCQRICLILSAALFTVVCVSCTPDEENTVKAEAVGNKAGVDKEKAVEENTEKKENKELSVFSEISEPEGKDFLLYSESANTEIYPQDFVIGPVQQLMDLDENESAIRMLVRDFTESIFDDELKDELVYSKRRSFVVRKLNDVFEKDERAEWRLGMINFESEPVRADIRFISNNRFSNGTIYFVREGSWKIFDLQMEAPEYSSDEKLSDGKWFPVYNKVQ